MKPVHEQPVQGLVDGEQVVMAFPFAGIMVVGVIVVHMISIPWPPVPDNPPMPVVPSGAMMAVYDR
ncbi:MAG: hypothetical protein L0K70_00410 [Bifidobacterium crudilactis]|nr:hypothetical protein [Bifidobacterium crudilactis]